MALKSILLTAGLLLGSSGMVSAQVPPSPVAPSATARVGNNCAPTRTGIQQGAIMPRDATTGRANEPLGDRLAKSDGVLCPPANVDPDMHAATPDTGNTPIIPPPGSPGGDPSIIPK